MNNIHSVAVIGLGSIALRHRKNLKLSYPNAIVLAMSASGRKPDNSIEFADSLVSGIQELIAAKPFFAIVASPSTLHAEHASELIEAGIPVLIEKPVTASINDAKKLVHIAEAKQTPVAIGYCLRYLSSSLKMKSLLKDDIIGKIYNIHAEVGQYLPDWRPSTKYQHTVSANADLGGGALLELSHEFDYIQWLFGEMTLEYAQLRNTQELGLEVEELADMVLTNRTGSVCTIHLDFLQKKPHRQCHIIGSKGRLEWDLIGNTITLKSSSGIDVLYSEPEWDKNQMYLAMINDFVSQIERKEHSCITIKEAVRTVELIEQIKQRAAKGITQ
jgi:predicted dehydrogenase